MKVTNLLVTIVILCMSIFSSAYAMSDEGMFENAKQFTIKIKMSIKTPFIFDTKASSTGTGFLVDKKRGWIITNAHVAGRSPSKIKGSFFKSDEVVLEKIYIDPVIDIAILKIKKKDIPTFATQAKLDCNTKVNPGYAVGAYGHPWGLNYTATRGIVSGTPFLERTKWIQTDAPINSGNSGGPLLSIATGHVVGINAATLSKSKTEGLNFALPIKYACKIVKLLKQNVDPAPHVSPVIFYQPKNDESLTVAKVKSYPSSQLKENDIIKGIKGINVEIDNPVDLWHELRDKKGKIVLIVERGGKDTLASMDLIRHHSLIGQKAIYIDGMTMAPSHLLDNEFYNLSATWLVQDVESGTTANGKSIGTWGLVTHINNKPLGQYADVWEQVKSHEPLSLRIQYADDGSCHSYKYNKYELPGTNVRELHIQ